MREIRAFPRRHDPCCRFSALFICFVVFSTLFPAPLSAQVLNIDREFVNDSMKKKDDLAVSLFLSSDKQKKRLVNISGSFEYDRYLKNRYVLVGLLRNAAVLNGSEFIQNEGIAHVRYRDNDHRKWSPEFFLQYQWNGAWGMEYRNVAGANLRIKLLEKEKNDFYMAVGGFYEAERWNWNGVDASLVPPQPPDISREMWRMNTYFKASAKLSQTLDFSTASFLQFPLNEGFFEPRWYLEANLFVNAAKKLEFVLHWDHILDTYRVVPIDDFYYTFSMGLQVKL